MTPPIRPEVWAATDFESPELFTLREAIEWYKRILRLGIQPSALEVKHIEERWVYLVQGIARREEVPSGFLAYMLYEMAMAEYKLGEVATTEATQAKDEAEAVLRDLRGEA